MTCVSCLGCQEGDDVPTACFSGEITFEHEIGELQLSGDSMLELTVEDIDADDVATQVATERYRAGQAPVAFEICDVDRVGDDGRLTIALDFRLVEVAAPVTSSSAASTESSETAAPEATRGLR